MPLPQPHSGETQDDFHARCMADETMTAEYPDEAQRMAVCAAQWGGAQEHRSLARPATLKGTSPRFVATITTDAVDAVGDVLIPQGMDATEFEKRRTVFWNHQYDRPIAKTVGKLKRTEHGVEAEIEFAARHPDAKGEWFPDSVRSLVEQGVVVGVSVGFDVIEMRPATVADHKRYGPACKTIHSKWRLFEFSIAPLQCNLDAVVQAVKHRIITPDWARTHLGVDSPAPDVAAPQRKVILV